MGILIYLKRNGYKKMVPEVGIEPTWTIRPRDFKSLASAYSATPAGGGTRIRTEE